MPLGLRQLSHRHEHEAERGVGDLVVEHAWRVGGDDSEPRRRLGVDVVVADAETGDDLEAGKSLHVSFVGPDVTGERDRPDARHPFGEPEVGVGLEPKAMQRQPGADQFSDQPHAFDGHQNIEGLHRPRSPSFHFRAAGGRGTRAAHDQPRGRPASPNAPSRPAHHAQRFSLLRRARSRDRGPARRPMRRERRGQDQSPRSAVAVCSRARPAPGGAAGMRPGRRRRRLCAVDRNRARTARPISSARAGSGAPMATKRSG